MEYFCNPANAATDSMVAIGTACTNAKNNVKEACEGIVEPDRKYEFDDKKKEVITPGPVQLELHC